MRKSKHWFVSLISGTNPDFTSRSKRFNQLVDDPRVGYQWVLPDGITVHVISVDEKKRQARCRSYNNEVCVLQWDVIDIEAEIVVGDLVVRITGIYSGCVAGHRGRVIGFTTFSDTVSMDLAHIDNDKKGFVGGCSPASYCRISEGKMGGINLDMIIIDDAIEDTIKIKKKEIKLW